MSRPSRPPRPIRALPVLAACALALAACSGPPPQAGATAGPARASQAGDGSTESAAAPVTIDVRTPREYQQGHLRGAVNMDASSGSFAEQIGGLDPNAPYRVYCRSGNRSARAVATMRDAGFTNVTDLGGIEDAAAGTGLEVVTD
ncbi:rhodanese-like domain-containing protein [Actinomyces israelii]|uniref:rhodanese-like domain-containing protein n=1 Tax=Actinomyces israelii TaxID=1659 RepID=UPI0025545CB2|nr:rhodanese-like domain-containing protein [Actinomyces israelii]WKR21940.1 hypothetical protein AIF0345_1873 [Actinomyces israelii]